MLSIRDGDALGHQCRERLSFSSASGIAASCAVESVGCSMCIELRRCCRFSSGLPNWSITQLAGRLIVVPERRSLHESGAVGLMRCASSVSSLRMSAALFHGGTLRPSSSNLSARVSSGPNSTVHAPRSTSASAADGSHTAWDAASPWGTAPTTLAVLARTADASATSSCCMKHASACTAFPYSWHAARSASSERFLCSAHTSAEQDWESAAARDAVFAASHGNSTSGSASSGNGPSCGSSVVSVKCITACSRLGRLEPLGDT